MYKSWDLILYKVLNGVVMFVRAGRVGGEEPSTLLSIYLYQVDVIVVV